MNRDEVIAKVKSLDLPKGEFVVFGSGPLAAAGIRAASDIDFLVSPELFEELRRAGWKQIDKGLNDKPLTSSVFEAHDNWNFSSYSPSLDELLSRADDIDGVPFAPIEDVLRWKKASGRPKDLDDIKLINQYLKA